MEDEGGMERRAASASAVFRDHFSGAAGEYAAFRPHYPAQLFEMLAARAPSRRVAWDCATGNGQAALGLAEHFDRVIATDASVAQLSQASPHPRVRYIQARAEAACLASTSVDLITVAQALHWFDLRQFFAEARRALRPEGLLAVWSYGVARTSPPIDRLLHDFYENTVGPFWPPERRHVESGYRSFEFPFEETRVSSPPMEATWTLDELAGYLRTWSATLRYHANKGVDPVEALVHSIEPLWGEPHSRRRIEWPLAIRAGRTT